GSFRQRVKKFVGNLKTQERRDSREDENGTKEKPSVSVTEHYSIIIIYTKKWTFQNKGRPTEEQKAPLKHCLREIFDQNPTKNRYKDVTCNDLTRVIIKDGKGSDYIHANYVRGQCLVNTFICTQRCPSCQQLLISGA
ncbi:hypothetical protein OSTOST_01852, partial [Ostertagia ostertagi]